MSFHKTSIDEDTGGSRIDQCLHKERLYYNLGLNNKTKDNSCIE